MLSGPLAIAVVVFCSVTAIVLAAAIAYREHVARQIAQERLEVFAGGKRPDGPDDVSLLKEPVHHDADYLAWLKHISVTAPVRRFLEQAECPLRLDVLLGLTALLCVFGCVVLVVLRVPYYVAPAGLLLGLGPCAYLWWRRRQRLKKFAEQLPDALELIARALRAGHSLSSGLQLVGQEMPPPIGTEFQRTFEEHQLGAPLEEALQKLGERVPNVDLGFFITAVLIQRQTGGDLAEILDKIGYIIRERFKIYGQVAALTAEGRLSGWILMVLPFVVFFALLKLNPDYIMLLFRDPLGLKMLYVALAMQVIGAIVIQKIVKIKV